MYQRNLEKELSESIAKLAESDKVSKQLDELMLILKDVGHIDHDINTPLCVITLSLGRVKRYANEYQNEGLNKSNNEIMEAVNKISLILKRLQPMKQNPLVNYYSDDKLTEGGTSQNIPHKTITSISTPFSESQPRQTNTDKESPPEEGL